MSNLDLFSSRQRSCQTRVFTHSTGEVKGIHVKRGSESLYYHRTSRGFECVDELFKGGAEFMQLARGKRILDLGCGGGAFVKDLRARELNAIGVDLYLTEEQKCDLSLQEGDAFALPFRSRSFDLILSSYSVFHYEPFFQLRYPVQELSRVLASGGIALLSPIENLERIKQLMRLLHTHQLLMKIDSRHRILISTRTGF